MRNIFENTKNVCAHLNKQWSSGEGGLWTAVMLAMFTSQMRRVLSIFITQPSVPAANRRSPAPVNISATFLRVPHKNHVARNDFWLPCPSSKRSFCHNATFKEFLYEFT